MKKLTFILVLLSLFLIFGCSSNHVQNEEGIESPETETVTTVMQPEAVLPNYEMLNEEIDDMPIKTQVMQSLLVTGDMTPENLRALLQKLYGETKKRTGFEYHEHPNAIYIYLYLEKAHYENGMAQWVAMLSQSASETTPSISVNEERLNNYGQEEEEKFGFSEAKRKEIWQASVLVEDRAMSESEKQFPLPDPSKASYTQEKANTQLDKQFDLQRSLEDKYGKELLTKYGITEDQLSEISVEAYTKSWAYPALSY